MHAVSAQRSLYLSRLWPQHVVWPVWKLSSKHACLDFKGSIIGWLTNSCIISPHFRGFCDSSATCFVFFFFKNSSWGVNHCMKLKKKCLCCDQEWAVEAALGRSRGPWRPSSDSRRRRLWNKGYDNNQRVLMSVCVHRCGTGSVSPGLSAFWCVCTCMVHFHTHCQQCHWKLPMVSNDEIEDL